MVKFLNNSNLEPLIKLRESYSRAVSKNQKLVQAISISSYNPILEEVSSRYVNLKYIDDNKFIFFTNYDSPKSHDFKLHNQMSAIIFWDSINVQIRIKGRIIKTSKEFNKKYFQERSYTKNALAISSHQSKRIESFEKVKENFNRTLESNELKECPDYWGGYSFTPYYFEFWEGNESRLNNREVYNIENDVWRNYILEP